MKGQYAKKGKSTMSLINLKLIRENIIMLGKKISILCIVLMLLLFNSGCAAPMAMMVVSYAIPFLLPLEEKVLSGISNLEKKSSKIAIPEDAQAFDFSTIKKIALVFTGAQGAETPENENVTQALLKIYEDSLEAHLIFSNIKVASLTELNKSISNLKREKQNQNLDKLEIIKNAKCDALFSGTVIFGSYQGAYYAGGSNLSQLVKSQTLKLLLPENEQIILMISLSYKKGKNITEAAADIDTIFKKLLSGELQKQQQKSEKNEKKD